MVGTEQRINLSRLYIELLTEPTHHTSHTKHFKGASAIHIVCKVAQIPIEVTDIPQTGLELFRESMARKSATQFDA